MPQTTKPRSRCRFSFPANYNIEAVFAKSAPALAGLVHCCRTPVLHACGTEADLPDYVIEVAVAVVSLAGLCFWVCLSGGGNPASKECLLVSFVPGDPPD